MLFSISNILVNNLIYAFNFIYPIKDMRIVNVNPSIVSTKYLGSWTIIYHVIVGSFIFPKSISMHT